jgi:hypothetical protein
MHACAALYSRCSGRFKIFQNKTVYSFVQNFWRFSTTVDDDRSDSSTPFQPCCWWNLRSVKRRCRNLLDDSSISIPPEAESSGSTCIITSFFLLRCWTDSAAASWNNYSHPRTTTLLAELLTSMKYTSGAGWQAGCIIVNCCYLITAFSAKLVTWL